MNDLVQLRKITMHFEEIYHEGGPPPARLWSGPRSSPWRAIPTPGATSRT